MSNVTPRFTIIIPVKDRAAYLYHTLRTCAAQEYDNLEVVVSDDGSTDNTRDVVEAAARGDGRIRYVSPGPGAGMRQNFEFALDQVKPGYVLALGGDDGLLPHGVRDMANVLRETRQKMLCWQPPIYTYEKARMPMAQLVLYFSRRRLRNGHRVVSSRTFLERQARQLFYVNDPESPMFYVKGVVATELIDRVRDRSADRRFYQCATPDGYSGIVLAGEVESWTYSERPFSLHGVSATSTGLGYFKSSEEAKQQSVAFFKSAAGRPMHDKLGSLPYSPLISLMTADYLLTARDLPGWPGEFPDIDFKNLLLKGIAELQDGLFAYNRVARELAILYGVAKVHGLDEFFRQHVRQTRRNLREPLEGNAFSPERLYIDATEQGLENVFDAGYFAYCAHSFSGSLTGQRLWKGLTNSAKYRTKSMRKGAAFPNESEWMDVQLG